MNGEHFKKSDYLQRFERMDKRVVLISNPVNHGLAYSLNTCIDVARGKYLARMDDDDISAGSRLQVQYDFMEAHPEVAYAHAVTEFSFDIGISVFPVKKQILLNILSLISQLIQTHKKFVIFTAPVLPRISVCIPGEKEESVPENFGETPTAV